LASILSHLQLPAFPIAVDFGKIYSNECYAERIPMDEQEGLSLLSTLAGVELLLLH
jgi:hypothetical protein